MPIGYVYVLSNPSIPKAVKIGWTSRDVHERALELSKATGVPEPFHVEFYRISKDADKVERIVHSTFEKQRLVQNREFFAVRVVDAISVIEENVREFNARYVAASQQSDISCRRCGASKVPGERFCTTCGF